jgi:hypothetical protein
MIQDIKNQIKYWFINLRIRLRTTVEDTLGMPPRPGNRIESKVETLERLSDRPSHSTELWDKIADNTCPNCSSKDQMFVIARGGLAMNVACKECDACYWVGPVREFGAEKIS